jgi:hypothetical protein
MDKIAAHNLLQALIDYFETGNQETDPAAKAIIESDFENLADWRKEIKRLQISGEWSGLRAPEAEILASALRFIQQQLKNRP